MKAAVIYEPGGPDVFKIEGVSDRLSQPKQPKQTKLHQNTLLTPITQRPIPTPKPGQVLIRIKATGLNRSEMFTRQGHSPNVKFPRILGIEATGLVEEAPGGEFQKGDIVATAMGEMGRAYDGGYV